MTQEWRQGFPSRSIGDSRLQSHGRLPELGALDGAASSYRYAMGSDRAFRLGEGRRSRSSWRGQPFVCRIRALAGAHGRAVAGFTRCVRPLELSISAFLALGQAWSMVSHSRSPERRSRSRTPDHRRDDRANAPARGRRKRGPDIQAIGRSRGGLSTKIHIAVDALGNPVRLLLTAGQVHDSTQAEALIEGFPAKHVIADKAYDADRIRAFLTFRADAVIPSTASRTTPIPYDRHVYKERHLVECFFSKIKHFRRVATRYDKTVPSFLAFVAIASFMIWLR